MPYKVPFGRYQNLEREDGWIIELEFCHEFLEFSVLRPNEDRKGFNEK